MSSLKSLGFLAITLIPTFTFADTPVPADHSTVRIVFVVPYEPPNTNGTGGLGDQAVIPRAFVGDTVLPIHSIQPISISIDGEFVGHAMPGTSGIKPFFILPVGKHKFEFASDQFKTKTVNLQVVGTGSMQYLIINLLPESSGATGSRPTDSTRPVPVAPKR